MEEASLGLAVVGVFESVNWNLRALAERKEPIVEPQPVLGGGLKLVSAEAITMKASQGKWLWGLFARRPQCRGLTALFLPIGF